MLYSTCSVLREENEEVIAELIAAEPAVRPVALPAGRVPGAIERGPGVQLLPSAAAGTDGFYYACVEKATTGS